MSSKRYPEFNEDEIANASPERLKELVRLNHHVAKIATDLYEGQRERLKTLEFLQGFRFN